MKLDDLHPEVLARVASLLSVDDACALAATSKRLSAACDETLTTWFDFENIKVPSHQVRPLARRIRAHTGCPHAVDMTFVQGSSPFAPDLEDAVTRRWMDVRRFRLAGSSMESEGTAVFSQPRLYEGAFAGFVKLESLELSSVDGLSTLDLSASTRLTSLVMKNVIIEGALVLPSGLRKLCASYCDAWGFETAVTRLTALEHLKTVGSRPLSVSHMTTLTSLYFTHDYDDVRYPPSLRSLALSFEGYDTDEDEYGEIIPTNRISELSSLQDLKLVSYGHHEHYTPAFVHQLPRSLTRLRLQCTSPSPEDVDALADLRYLEDLHVGPKREPIYGTQHFPDGAIPRLSRVPSLRALTFSYTRGDYSDMARLRQLTSLTIRCHEASNDSKLSDVSALTNLVTLSIKRLNLCKGDVAWLGNLVKLQKLSLCTVWDECDLSAVTKLPCLRRVRLRTEASRPPEFLFEDPRFDVRIVHISGETFETFQNALPARYCVSFKKTF